MAHWGDGTEKRLYTLIMSFYSNELKITELGRNVIIFKYLIPLIESDVFKSFVTIQWGDNISGIILEWSPLS